MLFLKRLPILFVQICCKHAVHTSTVCSEIPIPRLKHKTPLQHKINKIPVSLYGGRYLITMISGDGIGPELMGYVQQVFKHAAVPVDFEYIEVQTMDDVQNAIISIKRNGTAIKSNIENTSNAIADGSPNVAIRRSLDLYLNIVHCKPYYGLVKARYCDVDIALIRQNTEGEYAMLEHENVKGVVESLKIITKVNSERTAQRAFEFAVKHNRKKVTVVHKADIMKLADGLFLNSATKVAKHFPSITQDHMLVDNCCMRLVKDPKQFDVLLMPNLYGAVISSILCGILGGPGLFAGCNYGKYYAVFEPANRSSALKHKGKNSANPVAILNAAVEMLYHLGLSKHADMLDKAIFKTICEDKIHTPDLGGTNTSTDIIEKLKDNISMLELELTKGALKEVSRKKTPKSKCSTIDAYKLNRTRYCDFFGDFFLGLPIKINIILRLFSR